MLAPNDELQRVFRPRTTIDPDGTVVADMATGPEEILLLAAGRKAHNGQPVR